MFAKASTAGLFGIDGFSAEVEADIQNGIPGLYLTGAIAPEIREAQYRIWNALKNSGIRIEPKKITVNISPASLKKHGTHYDLPIAAAILAGTGVLGSGVLADSGFLGELGLDGRLKPVRGVLPLSIRLNQDSVKRIFVPYENAREAALIEGLTIIGVKRLGDMIDFLNSSRINEGITMLKGPLYPSINDGPYCSTQGQDVDFSDVRGQEYLKRAAEIAVSGHHNILFIGPAGTGKTMIVKSMATILPPLSRNEDLKISQIYSILGLLPEDRPLLSKRPFRSPHNCISEAAFSGGGASALPGELSLASGGILFLDELPLFKRNVLETLRQPLEERRITVSRMNISCTYPADFILAAAMNPCACGLYPDRSKCSCSLAQIRAYTGRLSKPLLDRIDICAAARPSELSELKQNSKPAESSSDIRKRVERARLIQAERFKNSSGILFNGQMGIQEIEKFCHLESREAALAEDIFVKRGLSLRTYHKMLKIARTIADMDGSLRILPHHILEAAELKAGSEAFSGAAIKY